MVNLVFSSFIWNGLASNFSVAVNSPLRCDGTRHECAHTKPHPYFILPLNTFLPAASWTSIWGASGR